MKKRMKRFFAMVVMTMLLVCFSAPVFAAAEDMQDKAREAAAVTEEDAEEESGSTGNKALAAGICVGLAAAMGAIGMGLAIAKTNEGIARQPEAEGKLRTSLMLGLVFIETAIIYALIVAILIIFVL